MFYHQFQKIQSLKVMLKNHERTQDVHFQPEIKKNIYLFEMRMKITVQFKDTINYYHQAM